MQSHIPTTPVKIKAEPLEAEQKIDLQHSPFSKNQKQKIVSRFAELSQQEIKDALIRAVLDDLDFPPSLNNKFIHLKAAYQQYKANPEMELHLKNAITTLVNKEGIEEFNKLLKNDFKEEHWNTKLLTYLAGKKIEVPQEPVVEAAIQDGKILWRIVVGDKTIYSRPEIKKIQFDFSTVETWRLSWEKFRLFKDSGKRIGTVCVTEERFVKEFFVKDAVWAKNIWNKLYQMGILDKKYRLSSAWHVITKLNIKFTPSNSVSHQLISDALYRVTHDETYKETIPSLSGFTIYRPARTCKTWAQTGHITNNKADTTCYTKIWDVSVYHELSLHRNTKDEKSSSGKLEYDHIPSGAQIKNKIDSAIKEVISQIEEAEKKPFKTSAQMELLKEMKNNLSLIESEKPKIYKKSKKSAPCNKSWAIAIPQQLHRDGETYLRSAAEQAQMKEHPFLNDVKAHVKNMKKSNYSANDRLKALGAFRYMYRSLYKEPQPINDSYPIGRVSCSFFNSKEDRKKVDAFFTAELQEFMSKTEGYSVTPKKG